MIPHNNSATYYDFVFHKRFGAAYNLLTESNLRKIKGLLPNGKILDFGAGTGRISIPLAEQGYEVAAIDKSQGMLDQLKSKSIAADVAIQCNESFTPFIGQSFDMVISIFTVLSYINELEELDFVIKQVWDSLKPGGLFMFDLVSKTGYQHLCRTNNCITNHQQFHDFNELVKVELFEENGVTFGNYQEQTNGIYMGQEFQYEENFKIRFWKIQELQSMLENTLNMQQIEHFNFANADYYIYKK